MISMILPSDSVGRSSSVSAVDLLSTTAVSNFSWVWSVLPVLRQSGEKSIGSESVMMSFQGWNWRTGLIISRGQYLTEDQPCIGKPRRPQVPGWRWWGRKGGQPWAAAEHSWWNHSPLTSDQWSHQADHVSRISCFLNWDINIYKWMGIEIFYW